MSRSCHRATSSSPADEVAAQHAGLAGELLALDRVALVRHGRAALLAGGERLGRLADLGALQVADLGGDELEGRADRRARVQVLGVAVPGDHLGGRDRGQPEGGADRTPRRPGRCWSTCRRRPRACRRRSRPWPARAACGPGRPAGTTGRAWRRTWSARRGCRGCGRPSGCRRTRSPGSSRTSISSVEGVRGGDRRPGSASRTGRCRRRRRT